MTAPIRLRDLESAHGERLRLGASVDEVAAFCADKLVLIEVPLPEGRDGRMHPGEMFGAEKAAMFTLRDLASVGVFGVCPVQRRIFLSQGTDLVCDPWDEAFWQPSEIVLRHAAGGVLVLPLPDWTADAALMARLAERLTAGRRVFVLREDRGAWGCADG